MKTIVAILTTLVSLSFSQSVDITGTVTDVNFKPIQGANVSLVLKGMNTVTDANGKFGFAYVNVCPKINGRSGISQVVGINRMVNGSTYDLRGRAINKAMATGCFIEVGTVINTVAFREGSERKALTAIINDTIVVKKGGYWDNKNAISSYSILNKAIIMMDTGTSVVDVEGNVYRTVKVGGRMWTAENYRCRKMPDSTKIGSYWHSRIPEVQDSSGWCLASGTMFAAYCYSYNDSNADSCKRYGLLYNFVAAKNVSVPSGWHVATLSDFDSVGILSENTVFNPQFSGVRMCGQTEAKGFTGRGKKEKSYQVKCIPRL